MDYIYKNTPILTRLFATASWRKNVLYFVIGLCINIPSIQGQICQQPPNILAGDNDNCFSLNDKGHTARSVQQAIVLPSGKIIVANNHYDCNTLISRLNPNGTKDTSFTSNALNNTSGIYNFSILPDGKLMVGGYLELTGSNQRTSLIRLNPDGQLDTTFKISPSSFINPYPIIFSTCIQPDGKLIAVGQFTQYFGRSASGIVRLNTDGTIDTTFITGAGFAPRTGGRYDSVLVTKVLIQPDGRILASGSFRFYNGSNSVHLTRLNIDGSLDNTFQPSNPYNLENLKNLDSLGNIIITGRHSYSNRVKRLFRLLPSGAEDLSFTPDTLIGDVMSASSLPDGKLLITAYKLNGDYNTSNHVFRLLNNGNRDTTYLMGKGFTYEDLDNNTLLTEINSSLLFVINAPGNKSYAFGTFDLVNDTLALNITRLAANGAIDTGFSTHSTFNGNIRTMVLLPSGKIIVAGRFTQYAKIKLPRIECIFPDGEVDTSFQPGSGFNGDVRRLLIQPDGKILAAGSFTSYQNSPCNNVVRILPNGAIDFTFNPGPYSGSEKVEDFALLTNGKLMLFRNNKNNFEPRNENTIERLNSNGTLDTSFHFIKPVLSAILGLGVMSDGRFLVSSSDYISRICSITRYLFQGNKDTSFQTYTINYPTYYNNFVFQPNNKILLGGGTLDFLTFGPSVQRLLPDGPLDTSFNNRTGYINTYKNLLLPNGSVYAYNNYGIERLDSSGNIDINYSPRKAFSFYLSQIIELSDGKLMACGAFTSYGCSKESYITRLHTVTQLTALPKNLTTSLKPAISIFPNPSQTSSSQPVLLKLAQHALSNSHFIVYNSNGTIMAPPISISVGAIEVPILTTSFIRFKPGLYLVHVISNGKRESVRWIVQ
jgi:uncharacterized delta-60 repeat protein